MEIETIEIESRGDKIIIPEGWKAIVKDGSVMFVKEQRFKEGDILTSKKGTVLIFKEDKGYGQFTSHYNTVNLPNSFWFNATFRYATEEEKQLLFYKMKEQDLRWNAEEKRVEKIRWEAEDGEKYYYVFSTIEVNDTTHCNRLADRLRVGNGNCFRTEKQAGEAAERVKETLRKYHEEIGE